MKIFKFLILVLVSIQTIAAPIVLSVGKATDNDCDFNSIFDAVNSGNVNMDIRVSNELITTTGVSISDNKVSFLSGGYFNCADAENGVIDIITPYSEISNLNNGPALSIIYLTTVSQTIDVSGFKIYDSQGGVQVFSGASNTSLTVNMDGVDIYDNIFYGLKTTGDGVVINYDHGNIENNIDGTFGGGVECYDGAINFGEIVKIEANSASFGAGIYARKCAIKMLAGDNNAISSLQYGVINNIADHAGGGIFLDESTLIGFDTSNHPVSISNNTVTSDALDGRGGGVYMLSGSGLLLSNARIDGNQAKIAGGAIASFHHDNTLAEPSFQLGRDVAGCSYAEICVSLSGNTVSSDDSYGAGVSQDGGGFGYVMNAKIENNVSLTATSVFKAKSNSQLFLINDLIINNQSQVHLIDQQDESFVGIQYSTFSENTVQNYFNVQYDNNNAQTLEVTAAIIKNGQATIAMLNGDDGNHDAQVKCSLVETDDTSGVVQNQSVIGLPNFVGNGNYKLSPNSIAINSNCTTVAEFDLAEIDIRGQSRLEDGTADLGAYESIAIDDVVFQNGLE